jgi:hypothetical protein
VDLEGMRKISESNTERQAMLHLKALMRKTASRCLLLTWREGKFNLSKMMMMMMIVLKEIIQ